MKVGKETWPEIGGGRRGMYKEVLDACDKLKTDDHISVEFESVELRARAFSPIRSAINMRWPGGQKAEKRFTMTQGDTKQSVHIWIKRIK